MNLNNCIFLNNNNNIGWKKIIVAQGPRQIIAGITVYALLKSAWTDPTNGM
jgi:hypothetical protein